MSTTYGGGEYQPAPQISFDWISQAWALFRAQMGAWIGALLLYFVVMLVIGIPLAFVTGYAGQVRTIFETTRGAFPTPAASPFANIGSSLLFSLLFNLVNYVMLAGLYRMAVRTARGETVAATDVFSGLDKAVPMIVVGLLSGIAAGIATYLCILPGFIVGGLLMFAPLLVVDRGLPPLQAMSESVGLLKKQWLMAAVFYFVIALVAGLGFIVLGVGVLFTFPLLFLSVALGYLTFTQQIPPGAGQGFGEAQPGVWPPPPSITPPSAWPPPPGSPPPGV